VEDFPLARPCRYQGQPDCWRKTSADITHSFSDIGIRNLLKYKLYSGLGFSQLKLLAAKSDGKIRAAFRVTN